MSINFDDLKNKINQEYDEIKGKIKRPNILLIGATGVGKSSLVNICFGQDISEVGIGQPVTKNTKAYYVPNIPVVLYDTQGYEIGSDKERIFLSEIVDYAVRNQEDLEKQIHLVWYCIQATGSRILDFDEQIIKKLNQAGVPLSVVFTKCDLVSNEDINNMQSSIHNLFPDIPSFKLTIKKKLDYLELNNLCDWSILKLPDALKFSFIAAQKINLKAKRREARNVTIQHTTGAGIVGFTPIPFSDAPILLANESSMLARILFIYDLESLVSKLGKLITTIGVPALLSQGAAYIVGQLLKLIPGIGTISGGLITGSVAATITLAIGFAVSDICYKVYEMTLNDEIEKLESFLNSIDTYFKEIFIEYFKKGKDKLKEENKGDNK